MRRRFTVAIGRSSSARAAGICSRRSCTQLPAGMSLAARSRSSRRSAAPRRPAARSTSATLWPCGTLSRSVRPSGNTVPAGRPPSLATIATLSRSCMRMTSGAEARTADIASPPGLSVNQTAPLVLTYSAYSEWLAAMNSRLFLAPPKHRLAQRSGRWMWADRLALRVEHPHAVELRRSAPRAAVAAEAAPDVAVDVDLDAVVARRRRRHRRTRACSPARRRRRRRRPTACGAAWRGSRPRRASSRRARTPARWAPPGRRSRAAACRRRAAGGTPPCGVSRAAGSPSQWPSMPNSGSVNQIAAVGCADDVVGRVEALAVEAVGQHGDAAVVLGARDAARQVLAGDQPALAVARVAVGVVRRLAEHAGRAGACRPSAGCGCSGCR